METLLFGILFATGFRIVETVTIGVRKVNKRRRVKKSLRIMEGRKDWVGMLNYISKNLTDDEINEEHDFIVKLSEKAGFKARDLKPKELNPKVILLPGGRLDDTIQ